jgi:membrane fusion protein, multidrug efflux system
MNRFIYTFLLAFLVSSGIISCQSGKNGKNNAGKKISVDLSIEGYIVKPTILDNSIIVSGTLKAFEETVLMPDVAGRVVMINLPEGKFVKKGTLLVRLFDEDLQANFKKLQTQLLIAQQTKKRQEELLKVSGISELEYDQTTLQVNSILDDLEILKAQISKTEVLAPFDGVIGLRNVSVGAQVTPNTPLTTIRDNNHLKLDFSVPEKYSRDVAEGKIVNFSIQGVDTVYHARIMASEGGIEANTRNLRVRAVVEQYDASLSPGVFAKVELPLGINPQALMIPTQAVIPQERDKKVIVARSGKAQFVVVKTGVRRATDIEVTDGLAPGDTVVTTGLLFLKPKASLKFSRIR